MATQCSSCREDAAEWLEVAEFEDEDGQPARFLVCKNCDWGVGEYEDALRIADSMNMTAYEMGADVPSIGDDYLSGTGELAGDDSYIDYLNNERL